MMLASHLWPLTKKFKIFNEQSWSEQLIGIWLRHEIQDAALLSEAEN